SELAKQSLTRVEHRQQTVIRPTADCRLLTFDFRLLTFDFNPTFAAMKTKLTLLLGLLLFLGCKQNVALESKSEVQNSIRHANGLAIHKFNGYSVVKVRDPWPNASQQFTYVLAQ